MKEIPDNVYYLLLVAILCAGGGFVTGVAMHYHNQKIEIMTKAGYTLKNIPVNYTVEWIKE
jgi:hypothetical protein